MLLAAGIRCTRRQILPFSPTMNSSKQLAWCIDAYKQIHSFGFRASKLTKFIWFYNGPELAPIRHKKWKPKHVPHLIKICDTFYLSWVKNSSFKCNLFAPRDLSGRCQSSYSHSHWKVLSFAICPKTDFKNKLARVEQGIAGRGR